MTRNEAIELLNRLQSRIDNDSFWWALDFAIKELEERPTAEWIAIKPSYPFPFECSHCGHRNSHKPKYCSNCGARMEGGI